MRVTATNRTDPRASGSGTVETDPAIPIFVVGKQGSGTTGLANHLCAHPAIAGVLHERHHGIHESSFFSHIYGRYGDLRLEGNYRELVEVLAASDYFRLAGADREFLYSLWPISYERLFRTVMDRYARDRGARYWVEKTPTHTVYVERLIRLYPDARVIGIRREVDEAVASILRRGNAAVAAGGWRRKLYAIRTAVSWGYYNSILRRYCADPGRGMIVPYRQFKSDPGSVLRQACAFLGLPFDSRMLENPFPPNTSYRDDAERSHVLSAAEKRLVRGLGRLFEELAPRALVNIDLFRRSRRRAPLPRWFFRLHPSELERSRS